MADHSKLSHGLREIILAILSGSQSREQVNKCITVCHALAYAFIISKSTTGSLRTVYDLTTSDLAYDSIGELFQQDERGYLIQLQTYFAGLSVGSAKDEELLAHIRRLVFSKVNQSIFRMYSEADPSLSKILRNIKLAIHSLGNFSEVERFGEACITPSLCDSLEHLPAIEQTELERRFIPLTTGGEFIPEILSKFSLFLREQDDMSRIIPLVSAGLLFRSAYTKRSKVALPAESPEQKIIQADTARLIQQSCHAVQNRVSSKYVESGKIPEELFVVYFNIVRETLIEKFTGINGQDGSLFEHLQVQIPSATREDYTRIHRNRIEYFLKLVDKEARKNLKDA